MRAARYAVFPALCLALVAFGGRAANIDLGETLAPLAVQELGECVLEGGDTSFRPWSSATLLGRVQVLEYTAARAGVDEIHRAFFAALAAGNFPAGSVPVTKLVNSDDALWGTSGLVAGEIEKNKQADPAIRLVVDAQGLGQRQWDLQKQSAALAILDPAGRVLYFSEGEMSAAEVAAAIAAVRAGLAASPVAEPR